MFEDINLTCRECGNEFVFTEGEQKFFAEKGLQNKPSRCSSCRQARKQSGTGANAGGSSQGGRERGPRQNNNSERVQHPVQCASCGKETTVPFVPKYDRPVYCSECFEQQRVALAVR